MVRPQFVDIETQNTYIQADLCTHLFAISGVRPDPLPLPSRPTFVEIDLASIKFNLLGVRRRVGKKVNLMAVVKANAYGHGLVEVARFAEKGLAEYFGVALAEEGKTLREAGIRAPILIFTLPVAAQFKAYTEHSLEATICSLSDARRLNDFAAKQRTTVGVHLKIETGMNRIGVKVEKLQKLLRGLRSLRRIEIKGVYTHFATADSKDKQYARFQLKVFERALEILRREKMEAEFVHAANSGAILDMPETYFSMVRPGIMMYGYYPTLETTESIPLRTALTLKSKVSLVKWIEAGESVSYGRRFIAEKRTKIATLPVGYADGFSRVLTGQASVLLGGESFPVVGTICMDQLMVNVGDADVSVGDEAILLGTQKKRVITAWDLALKLRTVPYEICCGISARVPRYYSRS